MKKIIFKTREFLKEQIAIFLYRIGVKPNATHFIDEVTIAYGYGKLDGIGLWEYQIPFNIKSDKR